MISKCRSTNIILLSLIFILKCLTKNLLYWINYDNYDVCNYVSRLLLLWNSLNFLRYKLLQNVNFDTLFLKHCWNVFDIRWEVCIMCAFRIIWSQWRKSTFYVIGEILPFDVLEVRTENITRAISKTAQDRRPKVLFETEVKIFYCKDQPKMPGNAR